MKPLAEQLHSYIECRAKVEGVPFQLSLEYFESAVTIAAKVFGVVHDGERMLFDEKEPYEGFFAKTVAEINEE